MARQLYQSITSRDIDDQRILESDWTSGKPSGTQPRMVVLDVTFPWWLSPRKKLKISIGFFLWYCWSKNPAVWLDKKYHWPHPTKGGNLWNYLPFITNFMQKTKDINWFFPEKLLIKESWCLIGWEVKMTTPNQNW